jgi:DNA-binding FadR family transcriptional regulator
MDSPVTPALSTGVNRRTRAAQATATVVADIERNISTGAWPPGHQLPTERELEAALGVARNTLRKGLRLLERDGKIVRHVGRGSFVAEPSAPAVEVGGLLDRIIGSSPAEVMEVRLQLEPWAGELAAGRANATDLKLMRDCVQQAGEAEDILTFEHWDGLLHQTIISAAKNELLAGLYMAINLVRLQPEWLRLKERTVTPARRILYQEQHSAIVEALCDRDPMLSSQLIRNHLEDVRRSLLGG